MPACRIYVYAMILGIRNISALTSKSFFAGCGSNLIYKIGIVWISTRTSNGAASRSTITASTFSGTVRRSAMSVRTSNATDSRSDISVRTFNGTGSSSANPARDFNGIARSLNYSASDSNGTNKPSIHSLELNFIINSTNTNP